jgi:DNA-binding beta-propeller fold protein YncE
MRPCTAVAFLWLTFQPNHVSGQVPEIVYDSVPGFLKLPEKVYLGEAAGVATNSKGHVFVYSRTGTVSASTGGSRTFTSGGSRVFEFDQTGKFVREIGVGLYGLLFAQALRVDAQDNIWMIDRGSNLVVKLSPEGQAILILGRKPEAVAEPGRGGGGREQPPGAARESAPIGVGVAGDNFNRPTDVAWDRAGNTFVADGYGNSRIAKFDKSGAFIKSWGSKGTGPGQFDTPHSIATDSQGQIYVADLGNHRIQVFDNDGNFKRQIGGVGGPWAICISPGAHEFLFSSNSNDPAGREHGEIYKMDLDGKILGKFGRAGTETKEFGTVNEIDCRRPDELYVGELINWRVQKIKLHEH